MTLAVRNTVVTAGFVLAAILFLTFCLAAYDAYVVSAQPAIPQQMEHSWLIWTWTVDRSGIDGGLGAAGFMGLLAAAGLAVSTRVFRRVSSPEVYFFVILLIALSFEQLRMVQHYILGKGLPPLLGTGLTRVVIVGRVVASLAFFVASLYAVGADYPRVGSVTIGLAVLAFLLVYFVPVDSVELDATLVHRVGWQSSIDLVLLILAALTVGNYVIAGFRDHRDRGAVIALAAVSVVIAREIVYFVPSLPWLIAAALLATYGIVAFILVTRAHFLWY